MQEIGESFLNCVCSVLCRVVEPLHVDAAPAPARREIKIMKKLFSRLDSDPSLKNLGTGSELFVVTVEIKKYP